MRLKTKLSIVLLLISPILSHLIVCKLILGLNINPIKLVLLCIISSVVLVGSFLCIRKLFIEVCTASRILSLSVCTLVMSIITFLTTSSIQYGLLSPLVMYAVGSPWLKIIVSTDA